MHVCTHTYTQLAQMLTHAHVSKPTALQGYPLLQTVKAASDTGDPFYLLWVGKRQCRRYDERHLAARLRAVNPGDSLDPAHRSLFERCRLWQSRAKL